MSADNNYQFVQLLTAQIGNITQKVRLMQKLCRHHLYNLSRHCLDNYWVMPNEKKQMLTREYCDLVQIEKGGSND